MSLAVPMQYVLSTKGIRFVWGGYNIDGKSPLSKQYWFQVSLSLIVLYFYVECFLACVYEVEILIMVVILRSTTVHT